MSSEAGATESWEFRSALEAPIAKLESLDEIDRQDDSQTTTSQTSQSQTQTVRRLIKNKSSDV